MIENLVFDFGNVLTYSDFDGAIDSYFDDVEEALQFKKVVRDPAFVARYDREEVPFATLISEMQMRYPQWKRQLQWFHDGYADCVQCEVPGMYELLVRYKQEGFHLYGLSNWCSQIHKVMPRFPIYSLLEGYVISSQEKLLKPDPAIYLLASRCIGSVPERCAYVGDNPVRDVEGAVNAGYGIMILYEDAGTADREGKLPTVQPDYRIRAIGELLDLFPPRS